MLSNNLQLLSLNWTKTVQVQHIILFWNSIKTIFQTFNHLTYRSYFLIYNIWLSHGLRCIDHKLLLCRHLHSLSASLEQSFFPHLVSQGWQICVCTSPRLEFQSSSIISGDRHSLLLVDPRGVHLATGQTSCGGHCTNICIWLVHTDT